VYHDNDAAPEIAHGYQPVFPIGLTKVWDSQRIPSKDHMGILKGEIVFFQVGLELVLVPCKLHGYNLKDKRVKVNRSNSGGALALKGKTLTQLALFLKKGSDHEN